MFDQLAVTVYHFLLSIVNLYSLPQLLGFGAIFAAVVIVSTQDRYKSGQFFRRNFLTDVAYGAWFPVYNVLIGIPLSMRMAGFVSDDAPFLRFGLLDGLPDWLNIPLWFVMSDFILYWLHRSMHHSKWLWALHKVHHSQRELNPLTAWRVHWLELIYLNSGVVLTSLLAGNLRTLPPITIALLASLQFALHSDLDWTYGPVGKVMVSPRFHARHHSAAPEDMNVNFGGFLTIWDQMFGTACKVPGRAAAYGLVEAEDNVPQSFFLQLFYPLSLLLRTPRTQFNKGLNRIISGRLRNP